MPKVLAGRVLAPTALAILLAATLAPSGATEPGATLSCPGVSGPLTPETVPAGTDVVECGLVGQVIISGPVALEIPPPGEGISAVHESILSHETGTFGFQVGPTGELQYVEQAPGGDPATNGVDVLEEVQLLQADLTTVPEPDVCKDSASRRPYNAKWNSTPTWYMDLDTAPAELTQTKALGGVRAAIDNITGSHNDCRESDLVSASSNYGGDRDDSSSVQDKGDGTYTCTVGDATSIVNFGNLPETYLAVWCGRWYTDTNPYRFFVGDIKINKDDYTWTLAGGATTCVGLFDLQAVMTHEWGHFYGLGHVAESKHPLMTMSRTIAACDNSARSLGLGDMRGLRAYY